MRLNLRWLSLRALLGLWFVMFAGLALAQGLQPVPALKARVTDLTGVLDAGARSMIELKLKNFEADTGSQIAVLLVPSTKPEAIEQFGIRVVDQWKLGRQGVDDGVLLLVALQDRKLRIEVGRGLEGAITDAQANRIIDDTISPFFRQGRFADGINAGVDALIGLARGEPLPPPKRGARGSNDADFGQLLTMTMILAMFLGPILRSMFGRMGGSGVAALAGGGYWFMATTALGMAGVGAVVAALAVLMLGGRGGGGPWITGSGHGGGFGGSGGWSGGGGFSGGGGGFSGGGASGGW
ncbi:TPM domain-containing protein [Nitrogeniibacter aestuarii]|uniref:TPM domain-containing protein n=1 Tax=Nitrogeniibacter aestuarii TaxID=2815343 RepID=UPI001D0FC5A1|nr:TPM domain-containing protein [Nitrogeniibacter aestuarii]